MPLDPPDLPVDALSPVVPALEGIVLGEELARGGTGTVCVVEDGALGRTLAAKRLHPQYAGDALAVERLLEEARITAGLEHPHVVPVHGLGTRPGLGPFFTMKKVDGQTMLQYVRSKTSRPLSGDDLADTVDVLIKVCDALAFAHDRGFVHLDLKMQNIMVGDFGQVYLMDWGAARRHPTGPMVDKAGRSFVVGTPSYLSPEAATARSMGPATDVFGVGALLYTALALRTPYRGGDVRSRVQAAADCAHPDIVDVAPDAPVALQMVCRRAMSPDPAERHPSVSALRQELVAWSRGRLDFPEMPVPADTWLMREGDPSGCLYIIQSGQFHVLQERAGVQVFVRELGPGDVVGEAGLLTGGLRTASVRACTAATVRRVVAHDLDQQLNRVAPWMGRLIESLAARFHERESTGGPR